MRIEIDGKCVYVVPFLTPQDIERQLNCTYLGRSKKGTMRFTRNNKEAL
ncbi:hypothetical protein R2E40_10150 [Aeromonas sp. CD]|nr:hypothetical protein [Aeromonas sp. CD]WOX54450.1 hypothetical protein R2E40_10150 [Aeromonas sp. CD]